MIIFWNANADLYIINVFKKNCSLHQIKYVLFCSVLFHKLFNVKSGFTSSLNNCWSIQRSLLLLIYCNKYNLFFIIENYLVCLSFNVFLMVFRRKGKICLVPVTRTYLFFWPEPKLFSFEYENCWSNFLLNNQEKFKERLKRSCIHSKN